MNIEENFKIIENLFGGGLKTKVSFGKKINLFREVYNNIRKNIQELDDEKKPTEFDHDQILETIRFLRQKAMYEPLDSYFTDFCRAWLFLVFNWNNNTCQSPTIKQESETVQRLLDNFISMSEVMILLKNLNNRLQHFKNWSPPAFEISKHFIDYLDEK